MAACSRHVAILALPVVLLATTVAAQGACIKLRTIADFEQIRTNLLGNFCLASDIDASSVANFVPIGLDPPYFSGILDGRGFVIRNLTISSDTGFVGLLGRMDNGAKVKNLGLVDVNVTGTSIHGQHVGALVGYLVGGASVANSFATGPVTGNGNGSNVGGLVGYLRGPLTDSYATGPVTGANSARIGGLVGHGDAYSAGLAQFLRSYATGSVTGGMFSSVGGLVGHHFGGGAIIKSYATGTAEGGDTAAVGGLVGRKSGGAISTSYATGEARGGQSASVGGLVGFNENSTIARSFALGLARGGQTGNGQAEVGGLIGTHYGSLISQSYAAGRVFGGANSRVGGLVGMYWNQNAVQSYSVGSVEGGGVNMGGGLTGGPYSGTSASYWDMETSGSNASFGGVGRTTKQLKARLPPGFGKNAWSITPKVSYPFLTDPDLNFSGALAIYVRIAPGVINKIYALLPISQLDLTQYASPVAHPDQASLATAYTMIARALGIAEYVTELNGVKIDTYFWDDATQQATWRGPIKQFVKLGAMTPIGAQPIDEGNVIGALRKNRLAIILGTYDLPGGGTAPHAMLATSFTVTEAEAIESLVANDPWTGLQVRIDPATKRVVAPADFPLANFTVDHFQTVSFK